MTLFIVSILDYYLKKKRFSKIFRFSFLNKGARSNHGMRWTPSSDMTKGRDGHSFAYILHYLSTGDLIYPLHEGFHRVDVLLKASLF